MAGLLSNEYAWCGLQKEELIVKITEKRLK